MGDYKLKASMGIEVIVKSGQYDYKLVGNYFRKLMYETRGKSTIFIGESYHINKFCRKLVKAEKNEHLHSR